MEASSNRDDEQLCSVCMQIDLAGLFRSARARADGIHLGRLEAIMSRASCCALCETIIASLSSPLPYQRIDASSLLRRLQNDGAGTDCWLYSYRIFEDSKASIHGQDKAFRLAVSTLHPSENSDREHKFARQSHSGNIQLSATSAENLKLSSRFHGRRISKNRVDLQQARKWLELCETTHGSICEHPGFQYKSPFTMEKPEDLTVINVHRMCLQALPPNALYVALSYCWPDTPGMLNVKATRYSLHSEEAFLKTSQISSTILEAIECTKELGEDFLWVDAMCITQDDPRHKMQQINQMDRIYGNAVLTIVAATPGKHARERLPGFSNHAHSRNQYVKRVKGLELMIPPGCLEDLLLRTRWETRGWTFQEAYLSRRLLFFTEHQAYFQCSCGICCEDSVGEYHHPTAFVHHSMNLWNPRNRYGADAKADFGDLWLLLSRYPSESEAFRAYCNFISVYLRRQLSFPEDILKALSGLLKVFERSMDTPFVSGLPLRWFDHALLWELYGPACRRNSRMLGGARQEFPSWSWTGWDAGSEPPYWLMPDEVERLTDNWVVTGNDIAVSMYTGDSTYGRLDGLGISGNDPQEANSELTFFPKGQCASSSLDNCKYLLSRTAVASMGLDGESQKVEDEGLWPDSVHLKIFGLEGDWIGLILVDRQWTISHIEGPRNFDFMLLSRAKRARIEEDCLFDETRYNKRPWCLLNVMLLKWVGEFAERIAVGVMHEDAWKASAPRAKFVRLI